MAIEVKKSNNVDKILERALKSVPKPYQKMALPPPAEVPKDKILFPPAEQKVYSEQELKQRREELWAKRPELKPESNTKIFWRSAGMGLAETVAPVIKEARDIPADDQFLQLSSKEQAKALARELNIFDKSSAIRKVSKEVVQFVFGLPIEFGLDVYESSKLLAGKPGLPKEGVNIPGFGNVLPRSRKVTEQQKASKDFIEYVAPGADQTVKDLATVLQPVITEDLFRVLIIVGAGVRAGRQLGKVINYKHVGTFTVPSQTVAENKSLTPLFKGKDPLRLVEKKGVYKEPSTKAEEFLFGKQKMKEIEMPVVDVNGKTGLVGLKATSKGIQVKIYTPRNLKGEAPEVPLFEKVFNKRAEPTVPQTAPQLSNVVTQPGKAPQPTSTQMPAVPVKAPGIPKVEVPKIPLKAIIPPEVKPIKNAKKLDDIEIEEAKTEIIIDRENLKIEVKELKNGNFIMQFDVSNGDTGKEIPFQPFSEQFATRKDAINYAVNEIRNNFSGEIKPLKKKDKPLVEKNTKKIFSEIDNLQTEGLGDLAGKNLTVEPGTFEGVPITTPDGTPIKPEVKAIIDKAVKNVETVKPAETKPANVKQLFTQLKDITGGKVMPEIKAVTDDRGISYTLAGSQPEEFFNKTWPGEDELIADVKKYIENYKEQAPATSQGELKVNEVIKTIDDVKVKQQTPKFIFKDTDKLIFSEYNGAQVLSNKYILDIVDSKDEFYNSVRELFKQGESYNEEQIDPETLKPLIESALKDTEKVESIIGYSKADNSQGVVLKTPSYEILVDPKYLNYFNKRYKNVEFFANDKHKPIAVKIGDKLVGLIMPKQFDDKYVKLSQAPAKIDQALEKTKLTQKEKVAEAIKEKPKTIKEVSEETEILEPNVRRILGVGAKEGTFERVDKGVYKLNVKGGDVAIIHAGDAVEILPQLAFIGTPQGLGYFKSMKRDLDHFSIEDKEDSMIAVRYPHFFKGYKTDLTREQALSEINAMLKRNNFKDTNDFYNFVKKQDTPLKADMIFLDIPYKTPAVIGGNRGIKYEYITPKQFQVVAEAIDKIVKTNDTPVYYMYSRAKSGLEKMLEYNKILTDVGFKVVAEGSFQKLFKDGKPVTNVRGEVAEPEGILLLNKSGNFNGEPGFKMDFTLTRPKGYQTEKPAELLNKIITQSTNKGDTILDPFMGSGVSIAEAVKTGRKGVGIEISEEAITKHAIPKIEKATKEKREVSPIPKLKNDTDGTVVKVKSFGREEYVPLLEQYKGYDIVMAGEDVSVWDKENKTLFRVALDDSKDTGVRFVEEKNNTVENAKKYIDWVSKVNKKQQEVKPIAKDKDLLEVENEDLTLPELKEKLKIAIEGKEDSELIDIIKKEIARRELKEKPAIPKPVTPTLEVMPKGKGLFNDKKLYPVFSRVKIKTLLQNNKEFMDNPVLEVVTDFKLINQGIKLKKGSDRTLYLQFTGKTSQFKIMPEALGLMRNSLKVGQKINIDVESFKSAKGEEIRVTVPKAGGGKDFLASKQGASINEIIARGTHKPDEKVIADFKISDEVIKIIRRFGSDVGEKHLSRKYAGIYKNLPDKVRVQALYDVTVATHEATHAIDKKTGLITDLIITTPRGNKVRKLLTNIYKEYYPGARRDHKLDLRMREGLATLIEKYFFNPAEIQTKYPELVNLFINPNGEYYKPEIGELLESMNTLVENYAKMTPEQRIGSRIRRGDEVVKRNEGFTIAQRANYEIFDRYEPVSRIAREAGVSETEKDPYLTLAVWDAKQTQINNWYKGKGAVVYVGNGRFELRKGLTVQSYFEKIKGKEKEFSSYLVARRVVSEYNKLQRLKESFYAFPLTSKLITELTKASLQLRERFLIEAGFSEPPLGIKADKELLESLNEILELNSVLEKDDFSIQDAGAVVSQYQSQFKEAEKIYDDINKTLLEYLYHAGRISGKQYNTWVSENGYSSFRRFVYDEMIGDGLKKARTVKATPGMLKGRTGSKLDIIDPVYSQVVAIQEGITLSIQNMFWHKMAKLSLGNMEVARRFEHLETEMSYNPKNGKVTYPQMSDPNIIPVYSNGKISFFKASPDLIEVAKQLQPKQIDDFSRLLRMFSGIFVRFTTSANPFFVIPNFAVDQFSLAQNTKTNAVPLIDPAKRSVIPAIKEGLSRTTFGKNVKTDEQFEMYSVIGGFRQTLANFLRTAPEDMATTFLGRQTKIGKAIDFIDSGISILELPSNLSEVMSRYAEYDRAIKAGASHAKALYMAQEATTPFNRYGNLGGQVGETWLKSIPYANASFQVTHKYFRAWKDNPKRVGTLMAGLVLSIMATTIALMKSTNEKQKRTLAQMPVDLLARGFYVPIPGTDRFARIRIPEQFGTISAIAQLYIISNYTGQKVAMDEWLDASTAWIPQQMDISEPSKWLFSLLPQAIKPEIEVAANVKTFPNLSTIEPEWYKNQPAEKRVFANTTKLAKLIGELTGWSPIKIDFYLREKFGTIVGVAQKFSTADVKSEYIIEKLGIAGEYYFGSGRLFDHFKQQQAIIDLQYNTIKANPDTYSHEEKIEVVTTRKRYNKIAEAFSIIREYEREKKDIPEDVKEAVFEILIALDTDDTEKVKDIFTDKLYLKVLELKGEIENK